MKLGLCRQRIVVGTKLQKSFRRIWVYHFSGIQSVIGIPKPLELAKTLRQFRTEHFLGEEGTGMTIPVLSGNRAAISYDHISGFFEEATKDANASVGLQIKGDPLVYAAFSKVAIVPTLVAVL